ncbi:hypothetical protein [Pelagibacterium sediminicola]|uniref:hypothetical protein n=1 Tax=Pelagibacterium sediminicola TaxID=2248761 RepID=UPI000E31F104|nr:hypothetical protein [Pelagibacterium sediminicola]
MSSGDIFSETQAILARAITPDTDPALAEAMKQILAAAQVSRWQRYDEYALSLVPATDADMKQLRDKFRACQNIPACSLGWYDLLQATFQILEERWPDREWQTTDIKEKFGGLRIYWAGDYPYAEDVFLDAAELLSEHICEECGAPGESRAGGWIRTLCDQHAEQKR